MWWTLRQGLCRADTFFSKKEYVTITMNIFLLIYVLLERKPLISLEKIMKKKDWKKERSSKINTRSEIYKLLNCFYLCVIFEEL